MLAQFARVGRGATAFQVGRTGAGDAHDTGQGRGDQPCIDDMPGAQHQVDLAQVRALHIDKAVDQMQVHIQSGVNVQEVGNHRRQVPATERCRCIHANQPFRRMTQGSGLCPCQLQLADNPPCPFGEGQARRGRHHRVGAALEQAAAHRAFQAVDAPRHRRGCQRMATCCGGKAARFQYIQKQAQLIGQRIGIHRYALMRDWHSHCALLCVSAPESTA